MMEEETVETVKAGVPRVVVVGLLVAMVVGALYYNGKKRQMRFAQAWLDSCVGSPHCQEIVRNVERDCFATYVGWVLPRLRGSAYRHRRRMKSHDRQMEEYNECMEDAVVRQGQRLNVPTLSW